MKFPNLLFTFLFVISFSHLEAQSSWVNPIQKQGRLNSPLVETSPFVFKDRLYLLENNQKFWELPNSKPGDSFHEDEVRIRDMASGEIVSIALKNHGFGTVFTWEDRVYVFAGNYGENKPWRKMSEITMTSSTDLVNWTTPQTVFTAAEGEFFFNTAICRGQDKFVMLYETNDSRWKPFTFRYLESSDLINWTEIPDALYGKDKYVGGPALYYEGEYYYTLYLESLDNGYETRIARSMDLLEWEDAVEGRPFVTFDSSHTNIPLIDPKIRESNASDVELCYFNGQTILYFTGSDQSTAGDLQWATYSGHPKDLFEHFFIPSNTSETSPPKHNGDWIPVLIKGEDGREVEGSIVNTYSQKPTAQQLAYQERQLGAFIHFGPASYIESDMMSVPAADLFNPSQLDAEQWVKTAQSFGAKHIVLTAKHHNGYCLWPTKTTDYSVKQSPWKNGQGDVVADFVEACRKYDMKIGLYVSGGDKSIGVSSTPDPQGERKLVGDIHHYFPVFLEQLRELLTQYGEVDYLWFDGAYDPFGWDVMNAETMQPLTTAYGDAITAMVRDLQPQSVIMGGTQPDVRWSGSEQGWAAYPMWNTVLPSTGFEHWVGPHSAGWIPAEANLHTRSTWFWTPDSDHTLRDLPFLRNVYFETIGRGANLLINMTPDTLGLIPVAEVERLKELGQSIDVTFSNPLASATMNKNNSEEPYTILFSKAQPMNLVVLEEDISQGQHVYKYSVEVFVDNKWLTVAEGESIGRKRIQFFDTVKSDKVRLHVDGMNVEMKNFTVYHTEEQ